ncbi:MAG: alcohol dehydrogenase [Candelina mexicana]|nr:MAG: alcohol dehydrogenase [Candelina mexicana]
MDFTKSDNLVKDVRVATKDGTAHTQSSLLLSARSHHSQQAAKYVRPRGLVVAIGLPAGAYLRAPVFESVIKMITIKGFCIGNPQGHF